MNYTSNHHLPQWVNSDRVRMDDFNAAMANIESGMSANASAASAAASNASQALAMAKAAYTPDNLPYVIGGYIGDGKNQVINLGFQPSFLIVTGMSTSFDASDNSPIDRYFAIVGGNEGFTSGQLRYRLQLVQSGFVVYKVGNYDSCLPILNELDRRYHYIAFR